MSRATIASKEKLLDWVNDQQQLDPTSKFILYRLAQFADAECRAWSRVETLAQIVNVSERTVQFRLRAVEEEGLIARTGRTHEVETKKGPRKVPVYQLAPEVKGLGLKEDSGENSSPESGVGVKNSGHSGETAFTPHNELRETEDSSHELSGRARAARLVFNRAFQAYPESGRAKTDLPKARLAWVSVCAEVEPEALEAAVGRYVVGDRMLKRGDFGAPAFEKWLSAERWRVWLPAEASLRQGDGEARGATFAGPAALRAAVVEARDEAFARTYLDRSGWDEASGTVTPWSGVAGERLWLVREILQQHGARLGAPQSAARAAGGAR